MTTTSLPVVSGAPQAAPQAQPVYPAEVNFDEEDDASSSEQQPAQGHAAVAPGPIPMAQPPIMPGEVAVELEPGARVPAPTRAGPTITSRAMTATKVRAKMTWARFRHLVTVTTVTMVLLFAALVGTAWVAKAYRTSSANWVASYEVAKTESAALEARNKILTAKLAEANRRLNKPWWKFWGD